METTTDARRLMQGVTVQHLRFRGRARESIFFEGEPGSALRGALYQSLSSNFCSETFEFVATGAPHDRETCPVCWLLAREIPEAGRGQNIPRPLTLQPPLHDSHFHPGEILSFSVALIGKAQNMLPYLARAVQKMGDFGVGRGRGRFKLEAIDEVHPLLDTERKLMDQRVVRHPTLQVTPSVVEDVARRLPTHAVTLEILTPMRLTAGEKPVREITPRVFMQRLIERCQNLSEHYAELTADQTPIDRHEWITAQAALLAVAENVQISYDDTRWVEAFSGSRRTRHLSPISGIIGRMRWEGPIGPLIPWLLWGTSLHVGKNAVKGSGYYQIIRLP
ncbi:MAG: CRISPR system precrRNA processing endoribonuclease RAMP protein Cas6 [Anaerolineae bacterium]|jgi:hypothetical protein|nr:CRISPR system precrRNA processing endoribonuclease RAMP protein Cas6 [Anaerolineae bacterium]